MFLITMLLMITKWTQVRPGIVYITCFWLLPPIAAFIYIGGEVWETNMEKTGGGCGGPCRG